jgi:hypothetical protein
LVQLGIIEENRINKPGKVLDKKTFYEYVRICKKNKEKHNIGDIKNYLGNLQMIKKHKKIKLIGVNIFNTNKDVLRIKNQNPKY